MLAGSDVALYGQNTEYQTGMCLNIGAESLSGLQVPLFVNTAGQQ
jgi:hypothetical protein